MDFFSHLVAESKLDSGDNSLCDETSIQFPIILSFFIGFEIEETDLESISVQEKILVIIKSITIFFFIFHFFRIYPPMLIKKESSLPFF